MTAGHAIRITSATALIIGLLAVTARSAAAQAFVPAQGEGTVSILFQDQFFKYHVIPTTQSQGLIYSDSVLVDVAYGLTDKVAVGIGLPWVATRYGGSSPHLLPDQSGIQPVDDGTWHSTVQDLRFDVRYNVTRNFLNSGIVVTPFVGSITPSHDYTYFAHAGFGRDLNEVQIGASAAKLFERGIPGLVIQARYAYGVVERVVDISHNRSLMSLEGAYFVTPTLRLMALSSGEMTHGGIDFYGPVLSRTLLTPDEFNHHDQIIRENMLTLGGGASFSVKESIDVFGSLMHTVAQRNGHVLDRGLTVGMSWSFTTAHARKRAATDAESSLVRCVCEKGKS
jgi:hypothetical protein